MQSSTAVETFAIGALAIGVVHLAGGDHAQRRTRGHLVALGHREVAHRAGVGRLDVDFDLVGLDPDERIAGCTSAPTATSHSTITTSSTVSPRRASTTGRVAHAGAPAGVAYTLSEHRRDGRRARWPSPGRRTPRPVPRRRRPARRPRRRRASRRPRAGGGRARTGHGPATRRARPAGGRCRRRHASAPSTGTSCTRRTSARRRCGPGRAPHAIAAITASTSWPSTISLGIAYERRARRGRSTGVVRSMRVYSP